VFEMISIGTLLVFYLVANALIYHRYVKVGTNRPLHVLLFLLLLTLSSLGFSLSRKIDGWCQWGMTLFGAVSIAITTIFHCTARQDIAGPSLEWSVPLMPWPAAASVFLNVFLITTLKVRSYQRFGIWSLVTIVFYVCYGVHSTYSAEENEIVNAMIHHANLDIS
jgi:hypothetical protein